jgi:hypothetical protein
MEDDEEDERGMEDNDWASGPARQMLEPCEVLNKAVLGRNALGSSI